MKVLRSYIVKLFAIVLGLGFGFLLGGCVTKKAKKTTVTTRTTEDIMNYSNYQISYNPEDYIGDLETFTYGLITNELSLYYETFSAYVYSAEYGEYYGIGFTNYDNVFVDDEGMYYFSSGMLYYVDEEALPIDLIDDGLELENLDFDYPDYSFVLTEKLESFKKHCVYSNYYLTYGVSEANEIYYNAIPFDREKCDLTLGPLYSYDEKRYLYNTNVGNYKPITGTSISELIDYNELERLINENIERQNENFLTCEIENVVYIAQEAVDAYFLSLQEEKFLGYNVSDLIEASKDLDARECIRINANGLAVINIEEPPHLHQVD